MPDSAAVGTPPIDRPAAGPTGVPGPPAAARPASAAPVRLPVRLRPMTLSDLLDGPFAVMKARPRVVFGIAASVLVPLHVLAAYLQRDAATGLVTSWSAVTEGQSRGAVSGGAVLASYLAAFLLMLAPVALGGALGRVVTGWYSGDDLTARQALTATLRRAPALLAAFLGLFVVKLVAAVICWIPVIPVVTLFCLTSIVIVVEGLGPVAGARRSAELIRRRFWPALGVVVVSTIVSYVLDQLLVILPAAVAGLLPRPFSWMLHAVAASGASLIATTALVAVSVLLYLDLRIRTEGLDIELDAADVFARAR